MHQAAQMPLDVVADHGGTRPVRVVANGVIWKWLCTLAQLGPLSM